nr:unnamed protein product [Spirometra erinaceieuropaei]
MFTSDLAELKTQTAHLSATVAALQLRLSAGPSRRSFGLDHRRHTLAPGPQTYAGIISTMATRRGAMSHPAPSGPRRETPRPENNCGRALWQLYGPLPLPNNRSYLFTCVDRFTRWLEAISLPDIATPAVVKALLSRWIATFGAPSTITTGRGAQFECNLFQSFLSSLGCTRIRATAYHPAANGMVERFHCQLKDPTRRSRSAELDGPPSPGPLDHPLRSQAGP